MRKSILVVPALSAALVVASCSSFLDADKATSDPNNPTIASINQLFVGTQAVMFGQQEGGPAMAICEWMQQCAGVNGRFVEQYGTYIVNGGSFDADFASIYTAGGLLGLRDVQAKATAAGDIKYRGVAKVMEAMNMMFGADIWGDLPYAEAVDATKTSPAFETQQQVYTDIDALLTAAIADLGGAGTGPGQFDLIYGGNTANWIQAAHTLKARLHLRLVERNGTAEYATVLTEANAGISASANDFKTYHTGATSERNMWAQFQKSSFGNDLVAGARLVNIMKADNDPRLAEYFGKDPSNGYSGYDVTTKAAATPSPILGSLRTNNDAFRHPIMTWEENQLIKAEALCAPNLTTQACTGSAGNQVLALAALNSVRTARGKASVGVLTLNAIMTEKYIVTFQNIEAWNDYKRTCLPVLAPASGRQVVPGRFLYGETEMQTNESAPAASENIQSAGATTGTGAGQLIVRNWNDPNHC